jgi:hypothetical protein
MRAAVGLLCVAVATLVASSLGLVVHVNAFLAAPLAISSTAGLIVIRNDDGSLVSYEPFEGGPALAGIGLGVVLLVAAVLIAASVWRRRLPPG